MNAVRPFLAHVKASGIRRADTVAVTAMGTQRIFEAYDLGSDTVILECGSSLRNAERPSMLIVEKAALGRHASGHVITLSTGNHAVAAFPLLDGRFWRLSTLPSARRSDVLARHIVCANVVGDTIELSQRDVPTATLVATDAWLCGPMGFGLDGVVLGERNDATLGHYRPIGQEWRVRPLARTDAEMRVALAAAHKRLSTNLTYYHSAKGVHFLTFPAFRDFAALARTDPNAFIRCLRELVAVYEGNSCSFMRMPKYRGHHEIELFGLRRGVASEQIVPELEQLLEAIVLGRLRQLGVIQQADELVRRYAALLSRPELADPESSIFVESLYMHITGEVYALSGEGGAPAFDDRRTALPGATFSGGRAAPHPGADARTILLLDNLRSLMSEDERVEYANVYELSTKDDRFRLGNGATREIVYKTTRRPLENSLIEKRLSHDSNGYGGYVLARIGALRALGIALSDFYMLLHRNTRSATRHAYYIRSRCTGEPLEALPAHLFRSTNADRRDDERVIRALAGLMGDAAAQNMAMKKYDPRTHSPLFGVGKEIYDFAYDIRLARTMPSRVSTCSIRGSFGWPDLRESDENFRALSSFYLNAYAAALCTFQRAHPLPTSVLAECFQAGFASRTRALVWQLRVMRDHFEAFAPNLPRRFRFPAKWRFLLWSLERQEAELEGLGEAFAAKMVDPAGLEPTTERL